MPLMTQSATPAQTSYIPSLDGLRAVSILIVFLAHAGVSHLIPGGFGVTVFFFLSGYLITTLLTREMDRHGAVAFGAFYMRRLVRLGPPLALTLLFATALVLAGIASGDLSAATFASQILFFYNYFSLYGGGGGSVDGLGILWSLAVEEHFYLIWPALFVLFVRGRLQLWHLSALIVAILVWRAVRLLLLGTPEWTIYISTDTRLDSMLFGCLLALMTWRGVADRLMPGGAVRWALTAGALGLLAVSFLVRDDVFRSTLRYTLQGIALMPIFHYAVTRPESWMHRPLNWAPIRWIGLYSYTIYLVHFVVIGALERNAVAERGGLLFVVLAGLISVGFAAAVYRFAERPLKPLRARLTGR
jgi:peptidoglycan/LPS O-acetylase OafA/YrhL